MHHLRNFQVITDSGGQTRNFIKILKNRFLKKKSLTRIKCAKESLIFNSPFDPKKKAFPGR